MSPWVRTLVFCALYCLPSPALFAQPVRWVSLPNGIDIRASNLREQITALRDDVLRVRVVRNGELPEDASWAVLPEVRIQPFTVKPEIEAGSAGFRTSALRVVVDRKTLRIKILDLAGNVLNEDARPSQFEGGSFRVYKTMPADEHYFGLGDKTGPLDRRDQAFSLWNTDAYRFQESTDPIYKSIPFFMTFRAGHSTGVLFDNTWRSSFDFGKTEPGVYSFGAVDGPLNYYFIYGPSPRQVVESYAWLTGNRRCRPSGHSASSSPVTLTIHSRECLRLPIVYAPTKYLPMPSISTSSFRTRIIHSPSTVRSSRISPEWWLSSKPKTSI